MSAWVNIFKVEVFKQFDGRYGALATQQNAKGWYAGYGPTQDAAITALKNEVARAYPPGHSGYQNNFIVTNASSLVEVDWKAEFEKLYRAAKMLDGSIYPDIQTDDLFHLTDMEAFNQFDDVLEAAGKLLATGSEG